MLGTYANFRPPHSGSRLKQVGKSSKGNGRLIEFSTLAFLLSLCVDVDDGAAAAAEEEHWRDAHPTWSSLAQQAANRRSPSDSDPVLVVGKGSVLTKLNEI